eukprot:365532-Chlamydomonas_euryale.AAC.2
MADEEGDIGPPRPPPDAEDAEPTQEDVGPVLPPAKKRKVLEFESQYLDALPSGQMYERSYMHRDTVNQVVVSELACLVACVLSCTCAPLRLCAWLHGMAAWYGCICMTAWYRCMG